MDISYTTTHLGLRYLSPLFDHYLTEDDYLLQDVAALSVALSDAS